MRTAASIAAAVRSGETTALAEAEAALARIAARNPRINAFTDALADRARKTAAAVDAARAAGKSPGPLAGVPFAVKNLFDVAGLPTRAGSKINRERAPAAHDQILIRRLEASGAVLVGALNMGEYAYDFVGENAHDGDVRNPHAEDRIAGGSSSGSGAAPAAGMVPLTLGSDTNGSIRVPSSFCGLFGLKPTYGRLSRAGSFLFCGSLDHLGPLGVSAVDLALAYDCMQGPDPEDPVCVGRPIEPATPGLSRGTDGLRIAKLGGYFTQGGNPEANAAVDLVAAALDVSRTVELPDAGMARSAAFIITATESAQYHLPRLRARADDFDPDTRDRFLAGALTPAAWYLQAQRFRSRFRRAALRLFEDVDILLAPATPCTAPPLRAPMVTLAGVPMPKRPTMGIYTQPISFIGLPVVVVPTKAVDGLPIGVQVIARPWAEADALRVAAALEKSGAVAAMIAA